jgi:23S rRNA pseudouridine1911/1915/1917 synthase
LFEDPYLLAVNKPGGLPTLPGGGFMENTLLHLVQKQTPTQTPSTVWAELPPASSFSPKRRRRHLIFPQTGTHLKFVRSTGRWLKTLHSTTSTNPHTHRPGTAPAHRFRVGCPPGWQTVKVIGKRDLTLQQHHNIRSKPEFGPPSSNQNPSGSIGHPLVGDPLYGITGQPLENLPGLPGDGGYFLHARFLKFHHPITGEQINLEAPLPSGFSLGT